MFRSPRQLYNQGHFVRVSRTRILGVFSSACARSLRHYFWNNVPALKGTFFYLFERRWLEVTLRPVTGRVESREKELVTRIEFQRSLVDRESPMI